MHRLLVFVAALFSVCPKVHTQCLTDRHNTSLSSHWISCQTSANPVSERGQSHWIMYELDDVRTIEGIRVWNVNHPNALGFDARELAIDYSDDGLTWEHLGVFEMPLASGSSRYTGDQLEGIEGFNSQFIVFTILSNYGGNCSGLGEVRLDLKEQITSVVDPDNELQIENSPNPFSSRTTVTVTNPVTGQLQWLLRDPIGRAIRQGVEKGGSQQVVFDIEGRGLATGTYFLSVMTQKGIATRKLIVIQPNN